MADPLTAVADQYAPAPLNFFDAGAAESVISKYANTRRGLAATDAALGVAARAQGMQASRERMERDHILADREDVEYQEKLANREDRAGFLGDLVEFDHNAPDANTKFTGFLKTLAETSPTLLEDPVAKEILSLKSRQIDKAEAERNQLSEIDLRQKNALALTAERAKYQDTMRHLTPEDWKTIPVDPETGRPDMFAAGMKAMERKREAGVEDFGKKTETTKNARKELLDVGRMDDEQKARFAETKAVLIEDTEAFPDRAESVRGQAIAAGVSTAIADNPKLLLNHPKFGKPLRDAQAWDKKKLENEVLTAKKYKTPDEYVKARGAEVSPTAEENRRRVWEYAHQNDEMDAAPEPASDAKPAAPAAPASKTLDGVEYVKRDGKWIALKKSDGK